MKAATNLNEKIALSCQLTSSDQVKRMQELHGTIFRKVAKTIENQTSYELVFKSDDSLLSDLVAFITFERLCCPWLKFQLTFQPGNGPVSLKLGNSAETKEMVKLVMKLDELTPDRIT